MKTPKPDLLCTSIALALALVAGNALAADEQDAAQAPTKENVTQLETLTVTARGVRETLQRLPLPVTAISEEAIERRNLTDLRDVANLTPGFSFRSTFGRYQDAPVIRGMSNMSPPASNDINTNASLFIDGIYVNGDMSSFGLENIAQVEVLRGPQAAAFGRSTFAGAVNYITRRPGSNPGGKITLGAGNHGQEKLGIYYSGGTEDGRFGYEANFTKRGNDSLFYNAASGRKDLGGSETFSAMGAIAWSPVENLDIVARVSKQKTRDEHVAITLIGSDKNNCYLPVPTPITTDPANYMVSRTKGYYCGELPLPEEWRIYTDGFRNKGLFPGVKGEATRTSLKVDYRFDNGWALSSITGINKQERYSALDQSYNAVPALVVPAGPVTITVPGALQTFGLSRSKDWSQGLRLSSDQERDLAGLFGVYYYQAEGLPGYTGDLGTGIPVPSNPGNKTVNKAVYGQVRWHINDQWTTSLEARYAEDELTLNGTNSAVVSGVAYTRNYTAAAKYDSFTPRWTLSYQATDKINLFGLVAKGNKPGGFNTFAYDARLTDEASAALIAQGLNKVQEEEVTNYELGIKSDWLDNTLRLNANVYQIDWENQGLTVSGTAYQRNGTPYVNTYTVNVGKTQIRGLELEGQWAFAPGWLASLVYAFTDSEIKKFSSADQADLLSDASNPNPNANDPLADVAGHKSPFVPRNKFTVGLAYSNQLASGWQLDANWDTTYEGSRYIQVHNLAKFGASTLSNFRLSLSPNETWKFSAYVTNVFDDDTPQGGLRYLSFTAPRIMVPNAAPATGYASVQQRDFGISAPMPRMFGLEVQYRF
ncbi:MAG: TonB-dependent receptor [Pseudoxanthomonas sp.]